MNKPLYNALHKGKVFWKYNYVSPEVYYVFKTTQGKDNISILLLMCKFASYNDAYWKSKSVFHFA